MLAYKSCSKQPGAHQPQSLLSNMQAKFAQTGSQRSLVRRSTVQPGEQKPQSPRSQPQSRVLQAGSQIVLPRLGRLQRVAAH